LVNEMDHVVLAEDLPAEDIGIGVQKDLPAGTEVSQPFDGKPNFGPKLPDVPLAVTRCNCPRSCNCPRRRNGKRPTYRALPTGSDAAQHRQASLG
jgi:hypothetical protein